MSEKDPNAGETDIRSLDEDTVARIAAGEVVERPASAVKELVENSLDADASRIDVDVEEGGTELIRVGDDGRGMTEADVRAAVRQHTTSKIGGLEDLEDGVATLGFRGEALHTIGSVSRLSIRTRPRADTVENAPTAGTELRYEGGEVTSVEPVGCPEGTTVEVTDLFYNTPARRKFLKTTATEFSHVNRVVTRYALANPEVAVSLSHDGREVFSTTGQGDLQAAVMAVYGREVAASMIPLETDDGELPPGPVDSISGLVSHPETNRSSREYLATYVNGRAVAAEAIREGIMGAYGDQLGSDRYPFVVCFLTVPGEAVDVNVHPRKREVRFDDDDAVRRQVDAAVESALLEDGLLRSRAPRGRSAPGEARIEPGTGGPAASTDSDPSTDSSTTADIDSELETETETVAEPGFDTDDGSGAGPGSGDESVSNAARSRAGPDGRTDQPSSGSETADTSRAAEPSSPPPSTGESASTPGRSATGADAGADSAGSGRDRNPDPDRKFAAATEQRTLTGETATDEATFDSLPPLRVLGQLQDTYVVCAGPEGLVLVDQHAADERINYERLQAAFESDATAQTLASPVSLELTAAEAEAFEGYREALSRLGFYADRVDNRTVSVTTVPAVFEETIAPDRLRDVLASVLEGDRESGAETVDALADEFLADLACYPSITGNTSLTEGSVLELLEALDDCENPYACPHGRPVLVEIDEGELEDRFERDYPGHA
ncbi:DNA mismatch repair endonuclease MutL [Natrialbaceae archaeon AArc-T1-2]|uniref:DNA mismatch repair endonuclease MutL n=1 Tax=Natrialbaceae archaeon AArc-T1-2 TaxID=3053904 RepID=UPI00255A91DA|nr:DNA mismatch repair endonuclease MutL [Natrialbaceae archaeon AArc-T1-2]WIV65869.1 DNA mismatch repair endonuclease MutL [Natrialbaceae archaeon AArc-T1-2]